MSEEGCTISITVGAGGDNARIWASMVLHMLLEYCRKQGWPTKILESNQEARGGTLFATFAAEGAAARTALSAEVGLHKYTSAAQSALCEELRESRSYLAMVDLDGARRFPLSTWFSEGKYHSQSINTMRWYNCRDEIWADYGTRRERLVVGYVQDFAEGVTVCGGIAILQVLAGDLRVFGRLRRMGALPRQLEKLRDKSRERRRSRLFDRDAQASRIPEPDERYWKRLAPRPMTPLGGKAGMLLAAAAAIAAPMYGRFGGMR